MRTGRAAASATGSTTGPYDTWQLLGATLALGVLAHAVLTFIGTLLLTLLVALVTQRRTREPVGAGGRR